MRAAAFRALSVLTACTEEFDELAETARTWLAERGAERFFLYLDDVELSARALRSGCRHSPKA